MKMNVDEKIAKLPQWAQRHIKSLQEKNDKLIALLNGEEESDITADLYTEGCTRYIPERSTIRFKVSGGLWVEIRLRKQDNYGKVLEVYTSDQAIVLPEATNHFHIVTARRFKIVAEFEPAKTPKRI